MPLSPSMVHHLSQLRRGNQTVEVQSLSLMWRNYN